MRNNLYIIYNIMTELSDTNIDEVIANINELQTMESTIYQQLNDNTDLTIEDKERMVNEIFNLSQLRINLFNSINNIERLYLDELNNNQKILLDQIDAVRIIEDRLSEKRDNLGELTEINNNSKRMIEINSYYSARYAEHTTFLKIIIYMMIPIIIAVILLNNNLINNTIFYGMVIIISFIGGYYLIKRYLSMINRNNMEYNAYNWGFNKDDAPKPGKTIDNPWNKGLGQTCIGQNCCSEGMTWDSSLGKCISACSVESATGESEVSEETEGFSGYKVIYQKEQINNNRKPDVILDNGTINPYEGLGFRVYK